MPAINDTVTYSTTIAPSGVTAPVSYSWSVDSGGTFVGSTTSSSVQVQWNSVGTFTLSATASNSCNTVVSHFQVEVTQNLWSYTHTATECGTFTKQGCPGGCTPSTETYCQSATETRDSTVSQPQAVLNAQAAAIISAQLLVNAGGQTHANNNGSCDNCPCTEVWTDSGLVECGQTIGQDVCKQYKQQTNQCNANVQWIEIGANTGCPGCVTPCNLGISVSNSNNGVVYTVVTTPSGGVGTIELSQNGGAGYGALGNATLNAGTYTFCVREQANPTCTACQTFTLNTICNPNVWTPVANTRRCVGLNWVEDQTNDCGGNQVFTLEVNSPNCCTSNWVDDGINFTCGQNIPGGDPCKVYKQQVDGCGNTRWVFSSDNTTCGGCCVLPTVALAGGVFASNVSLPVIGGPNDGRRFINLSNQHNAPIEIEISLNGNTTQTTIVQNTVGQIQFFLPIPWVQNSGDVVNYKFWFSAYLSSCNVTSSGTVL